MPGIVVPRKAINEQLARGEAKYEPSAPQLSTVSRRAEAEINARLERIESAVRDAMREEPDSSSAALEAVRAELATLRSRFDALCKQSYSMEVTRRDGDNRVRAVKVTPA